MAKHKSSGGLVGLIAAICLFLLILFVLPSRVGARDLCNGRGYRNATDALCSCISGYHGEACEYKHCPFGKSWFSKPLKNNERNMPLVPCSNMGSCDSFHGHCKCRSGFEGSACERTSCATTLTIIPDKTLAANIKLSGAGVLGQVDSDLSNTPQCSGHGLCKTMREMGNEFNGHSLVRAPVNYANWEADSLQSCLCDEGWEGFDCSQRSCPKGKDPTVESDVSRSLRRRAEEVFVLHCQADSGFFSIFALGRYSEPIPFDADPGYLKSLLEGLSPNVGNVEVKMPAVADQDGEPSVCGASSPVATVIVFTEHRGDRPPMFLSRNTSNTRMWPAGAESLALGGSVNSAVLRFSTEHVLSCGVCPACFGHVHFQYGSSLSAPVDITSTSGAADLIDAIEGLEDLQAARWTNLEVVVVVGNPGGAICDGATAYDTEIYFYADYGNIPFLVLFDASYLDPASVAPANLTLQTNAAVDTAYECSNQGICDYSSGQCQCFQTLISGDVRYRALSSDGNGNLGLRGDCGHLDVPVGGCLLEGADVCNGQGICNEATGRTCQCFDGFSGITCELRECPLGPAWFDEPTAGDVAHAEVTCSNMGKCDKTTGICKCRDGYSGPACEIRDCHRDSNYVACSGHGSCVDTARLFELFGLSYGNVTTDYIKTGGNNWDAYRWHHCLCSANAAAGFMADPLRPSVGPSALVGGTATGALPLAGWDNWDCSLRNCPKGHTSNRRAGLFAAREEQRVVCTRDHTANASDYLVFRFMGAVSQRIYLGDGVHRIRAALEHNPHIGNLTVSFPNFDDDGLNMACNTATNATHGGFLVRFDTEWGDLPLLDSLYDDDVTVLEVVAGNSTNEECGGSAMGFCDRISGNCICNAHRASSDGTGLQPGRAGDCSYFIPSPVASQDTYTLFGFGKTDF